MTRRHQQTVGLPRTHPQYRLLNVTDNIQLQEREKAHQHEQRGDIHQLGPSDITAAVRHIRSADVQTSSVTTFGPRNIIGMSFFLVSTYKDSRFIRFLHTNQLMRPNETRTHTRTHRRVLQVHQQDSWRRRRRVESFFSVWIQTFSPSPKQIGTNVALDMLSVLKPEDAAPAWKHLSSGFISVFTAGTRLVWDPTDLLIFVGGGGRVTF